MAVVTIILFYICRITISFMLSSSNPVIYSRHFLLLSKRFIFFIRSKSVLSIIFLNSVCWTFRSTRVCLYKLSTLLHILICTVIYICVSVHAHACVFNILFFIFFRVNMLLYCFFELNASYVFLFVTSDVSVD